MKKAQQLGRSLVDILLPPQCLISGGAVSELGQIHPDYWKQIHFIDGPLCDRCGRPFPFDPGEGLLCSSCVAHAPKYDRARAVFVYDDNSRDLLMGLKYGDRTDGVAAFGSWMARVGAPH